MNTFHYCGHEALKAYVENQLVSNGWKNSGSMQDADVIVTYFTHSSALEDAYLDHEGIVREASPSTLVIDLSPATPSLAHELSGIASVNDLRYVEAPIVFRGSAMAGGKIERSSLRAYIAGEPENMADGREVALALAAEVVEAGESGSAQLMKCAATIVGAAEIVGALESEALVKAVSASLEYPDENRLNEMLVNLGGGDVRNAARVKSFNGDVTVEMVMGDIVAALATAEEGSLTLPQLETAMRVFELLAIIGGSDLAPSAAALVYSDEEEGASTGLDWARAQEVYDAHHDHAHEEENWDEFADYGGYDEYDRSYDGSIEFEIDDDPEGRRWPL